jgi:hypothetical protein
MELFKGWRMVEEEVQDQSDDIEDDAHVETPSPALLRILYQAASNNGSKDGKGERRNEDERDDGSSMFVRDELSEDNTKG